MPPGSIPRPRPTRRSTPWLLATLTLALALAGPANADTFGGAEMPDPETVLATEVPEASVAMPPESMESVEVPTEALAMESAPAAPEPPPPPDAPAVPESAEEPVSFSGAEPAPVPPAPPAPPPEPVLDVEPAEEVVPEAAPAPVVPLNLNVDIRILSPGDDGDVNQVIDLGGAPNLGGGGAADALGGIDWSWDWEWNWDCGDASAAGLGWNWSWNWSGECAAGLFDEADLESMRELADRPEELLEALDPGAIGVPFDVGEGDEPLVAAPGGGEGPSARADRADDASAGPAPASGDGHLAPLTLSPTIFASNGAPSRQEAATAPTRSPAAAAPNGDPERWPAGPLAQAMGLAAAAGGGGGGGGGFTVLLLAALVGALTLVPPPPGGRVRAVQKTLSSLLSSSRLERPG